MEFFYKSQKLFAKNLNQELVTYPTFIHVKSIFKDEWYNFVVPTVDVIDMNWEQAEGVIGIEREKGYKVSWYVAVGRRSSYDPELVNRGYKHIGSDTYVLLNMKRPFDMEPLEFSEIDESSLTEYKKVATACFPEWPNSEAFSQFCFDLANRQEVDKLYKNVAIYIDGQIVSFGSLVASRSLKLAYLHNVGTVLEYRRQGLFTGLNRYLCNLAYEFGSREVFALVEEGSVSQMGYKKLGFEQAEQFWMYSGNEQ